MNTKTLWLSIAIFLFCITPASAQDSPEPTQESSSAPLHNFGLRIEPGLAIPLSSPQSDRFDLGGGQTVKGFYNLTPAVDVGPTVSFTDVSDKDGVSESGRAWDFGAGVRVKGAITNRGLLGMFPWVDADLLYVRTGELDRPGFDAGTGLAFPVGRNRAARIGPFVRYRQIIQGDQEGIDHRDAKLLHAGISIEFGGAVEQRKRRMVTRTPAETAAPSEETCEPCPEPEPSTFAERPDRDGDGFPDIYDRCPDESGPKENFGCPEYEDAEVLPGRIELTERIYFEWNKAEIRPDSEPVLNRAAKVLKDNDGFRVRVEGHADATGLDGYNQTLSEQRAQAVVDHLVEQGVPRDRFEVQGYSSSRPADTNLTAEGRQKNRRVEFDIDLEILEKDAE